MTATNEDRMTFKILEDGTVVTKVDGISGANHAKADQLVGTLAKLLGGPLKKTRRPEGVGHARHTHHRKAGH